MNLQKKTDLEATKEALDDKDIEYVFREHYDFHPRNPSTSYTLQHGNILYVFNSAERLIFLTDRADYHQLTEV